MDIVRIQDGDANCEGLVYVSGQSVAIQTGYDRVDWSLDEAKRLRAALDIAIAEIEEKEEV